jgi:hypothetical protein
MSEIIMFDFDDGYPLEKCAAYLHEVGISAYLTTSKSHQKEKGDKPACDRYRVMIPFDKPIDFKFGQYQQFYKYICNLLGFETLYDAQTPDPTRMFFPNPNQETIFVSTGQMLSFDFLAENFLCWQEQEAEKVRMETEERKKEADKYRRKSNGKAVKLKENELPRSTIIETKRGSYLFSDFEYLQGDQTEPCRCPNPAHPDKNPSAFVGRSKNSGGLMVRCIGCGFLAYMGDV